MAVTNPTYGAFQPQTTDKVQEVKTIYNQGGTYPYGQSDGTNPFGDQGKGKKDSSGGGGGTGNSPTQAQRDAAANLGVIAGYNAGTVKGGYDKSMKAYDLSSKQNAKLRDTSIQQSRVKSGDEWFANQQKLQASLSSIMGAAGRAAEGSGLLGIRDTLAKVDDMSDVSSLGALRDNMNSAYNNYSEAEAAINDARRRATIEAWTALRQGEADQAAQMNNINPELFGIPGTKAKGGKSNTSGTAKGKAKKGDRISGTDWGSASWMKNNPLAPTFTPQSQGFFRGDGDTSAAPTSRAMGSADPDYWRSMGGGYGGTR